MLCINLLRHCDNATTIMWHDMLLYTCMFSIACTQIMMSAKMVLTCALLMPPALILTVNITVHVTQDMKEMVSIVQVST